MKNLAKWGTLVVVVLLVVCVAKYLDVELGFTPKNGSRMTLRVPNLTHLSTYLNGGEYQFGIEDVCLGGFVFLLTVCRCLFLRKERM